MKEENRFIPEKYPEKKQKKTIHIQVSQGDLRELEEIQTQLAVGQSEAVRTAVRVYAALLKKK